jgi:hypothetical protein
MRSTARSIIEPVDDCLLHSFFALFLLPAYLFRRPGSIRKGGCIPCFHSEQRGGFLRVHTVDVQWWVKSLDSKEEQPFKSEEGSDGKKRARNQLGRLIPG